MLDFLGGIFSSVVGGGITGILGVGVQRIFDYKNKQLDIQLVREKNDHEVMMKKADAEIMAQEWAARSKIAETEAAGREAVADANAFAASFNEPVRYSENVKPSKFQGFMLIILDFIRGIVRPALTTYLCVLSTLIYFHCKNILDGQTLDSGQALDLMRLLIQTILYLMTTCTLWWFGSRNKQPAPKL